MNIYTTEARLYASKLEAEGGTAEALTSADADVRARSLELSTLEVEFDDESSKFATGDHTHDEAIAGVRRMQIDLGIKLAVGEHNYDNSATDNLVSTKLPYSKEIQSAGHTEVIIPSTTENDTNGVFEFVPSVSDDANNITSAIFDKDADGDTWEYKLGGGVSNMKMTVEGVGKPIMLEFNTQGKVASVDNVTALEFDDANALSTLAEPLLNTEVSIQRLNRDGSALAVPEDKIDFCIQTFAFETGSEIGEVQCQADPSGILKDVIVKRNPSLTINPLLRAKADFDFWTSITAMEIYEVKILQRDSNGDVRGGLTISRGQIMSPSGTDDNGFRRNELKIRPLRNLQGATAALKENDYTIIIGANNIIAP